MSKLYLADPSGYDVKMNEIARHFSHKVEVYPPGSCPITMQISMLRTAANQTCGKCVPCRDGLPLVARLMQKVLDGRATEKTLDNIRMMATMIRSSADCAIGWNAADEVLKGLDLFADEYQSHIENKKCLESIGQKVPCISLCPAHVNIPGYIALVGEEDYAGAINLIRKDNPFPTACALICEHPCEARCRRNIIDDSINIRGMKRYIVDNAPSDKVPVPACAPSTGKKVAIIGGGPSGLTSAYFLQLMGHQCTVFEEKKQLGGMLRYGIPNYRFPRERLQEDINAILSTGVDVKLNTTIGTEELKQIQQEYDAIYVAIGAHTDKKLGLEGEDSKNVISAVDMLREIGDGAYPDYTGKRVVVVGGGNVAMDCARTAMRANAETVSIVYRRRQEDMTALPAEVEGAIAEGIELVTLKAPLRVEADAEGNACALWVQPQIIGPVKGGRPSPRKANKPEERMECDIVLVAIGQDIVSGPFADFGMAVNRGRIAADKGGAANMVGVYAGGDCVSGPATVIKAIAAGKAAAANIDEYLGYHHPISCDVEIPEPMLNDKVPCGRVNLQEVEAWARKTNFEGIELPMSCEEAVQEASRCLRCDRHGCGTLRGGREFEW